MTMTPNQIKNAYRATLRLSNAVFPYKVARSISNLGNRLAEEVKTVSNVEKAIIEKYGGTVERNGAVTIEDPENACKCVEELNDFREQGDDIKLPVVDLSKYVDSIRISPADIDALEGLVIFERCPKPEEESVATQTNFPLI